MQTTPATILVIDDEPPIRKFLRTYLESQDYRIIESDSGKEGMGLAASHNPDVILLDLGLPDIDGLDVVARLREWSQVPIIILSARGKEEDKIEALDRGASDYLVKPFGVGELAARIRVALRLRAGQSGAPEARFECGGLSVDLAARRVRLDGGDVHLTPIEFKLLSFMVRNAEKVITHRQLLKEVWGVARDDQGHYLRIYIHQLRHKIEAVPARPRFILTEPGVGYRFICDKS